MSFTEEKARIRAITGHELAGQMRNFANYLALESNVTAEEAFGIMAALAEDLATPATARPKTYENRSTFGAEEPVVVSTPKGRWADAVASANARRNLG